MLNLPEYVGVLRRDVRLLRIHNQQLQRSQYATKRKISELKEENKRLRKERRELEKEKRHLEKEQERLKREIEKLTKTNKRYQVALFDHGNFKPPDKKNKKKKGGQIGHANTNREIHEDYTTYQKKRLFAKSCGTCGNPLNRVSTTRKKILVDIVINPEIVKIILESERQWCGGCKMEVIARDNRSLPFTEYGINTFLIVMILRFKSHASMENIATVVSISHGLKLAKSDVSNLLKQAKEYSRSRYEELKKAVQKGAVIYADETGWLVNGQKAWLWIMANEEVTVYYAAESRGKGIAEELYGTSTARCMHDGLRSYDNAIAKDKHCYCWAHILRFAHEECINEKEGSSAIVLKDALIRIYHIKSNNPEYSLKELEAILRRELDKLLAIHADNQSLQNIQQRLKVQKEGLINSMIYTPDGTNNLAERELRPMVINKRISNGSNTYKGMETTAIVGSVVQTITRRKADVIPTLKDYLVEGVKDKYRQYRHLAFLDDS